MQIIETPAPAEALAKALESAIVSAPTTQVLCFCAGGSALKIFQHITNESVKRRTIFMMGDERASGEETTNNYLQLKKLIDDKSGFTIESTAFTDTSLDQFATRLSNQILEITERAPTTIFAILGIGEDGHTAGIFPLPKESFQEVYPHEGIYVSVALKSLTIDSRASLTPDFILNRAARVFGYATGSTKQEIIKRLIDEEVELNERPAELLKRHKNAILFTDVFTEPKE